MTTPATTTDLPTRKDKTMVLVVFSGETEVAWLRLLLKKGFRHCFVVIDKNDHRIICNPLFHQTEIATVGNVSLDKVAEWYENLGMTVVNSFIRDAPQRAAPCRPYTCVEAVKRIIGIQAGRILTPYQLYKHLIYENSNKILAIVN